MAKHKIKPKAKKPKLKPTMNFNKDQLSLTNRTTRCITANVLQTNKVDVQCDQLATDLS